MYLCAEDIGFISFYVFVCWGYQFYLFLCICVLSISVLPPISSTYKYIERGKTISSTHKYIEKGKTDILRKQIIERGKTDIFNIGFTSFYVFVCWGYRFYLFLCICVLRISVLPLSMYLCVEDISFTSFLERGQTDILNTQIYRKR
jgi:hypothetical protein